jgi:hypothetical protein
MAIFSGSRSALRRSVSGNRRRGLSEIGSFLNVWQPLSFYAALKSDGLGDFIGLVEFERGNKTENIRNS